MTNQWQRLNSTPTLGRFTFRATRTASSIVSSQSPEWWHYESMIGIHVTALFDVHFVNDRVVS